MMETRCHENQLNRSENLKKVGTMVECFVYTGGINKTIFNVE